MSSQNRAAGRWPERKPETNPMSGPVSGERSIRQIQRAEQDQQRGEPLSPKSRLAHDDQVDHLQLCLSGILPEEKKRRTHLGDGGPGHGPQADQISVARRPMPRTEGFAIVAFFPRVFLSSLNPRASRCHLDANNPRHASLPEGLV